MILGVLWCGFGAGNDATVQPDKMPLVVVEGVPVLSDLFSIPVQVLFGWAVGNVMVAGNRVKPNASVNLLGNTLRLCELFFVAGVINQIAGIEYESRVKGSFVSFHRP